MKGLWGIMLKECLRASEVMKPSSSDRVRMCVVDILNPKVPFYWVCCLPSTYAQKFRNPFIHFSYIRLFIRVDDVVN